MADKDIATNKEPLIVTNANTGEKWAGFLDPETGDYIPVILIEDERDIDKFLDEYNLAVCMVSKSKTIRW